MRSTKAQTADASRRRSSLRSAGLHRPFLIFFTLPALVSIVFLLLGLGSVYLDLWLDKNGVRLLEWAPPSLAARDFLSSVATGAITALSLAYSLTLIVFTLAAGNIGPRLLQRFTSELTIQIAAGIFGGTFLFALTALFFTDDAFVPELTILLTALLALVSVVQLIYFVRHVASNVTIDDEIHSIGQTLTQEIDTMMDRATDLSTEHFTAGPCAVVEADADGYLGLVDVKAMAAWAQERNLRVAFRISVGKYMLCHMPLIEVRGTPRLSDGEKEELLGMVQLAPSRSQSQSVDFAIHLLLEIALRGLSPGVNDTFTAVACLNRLTSALSRPVRHGLDARYFFDENDVARIFIPGLSVRDLIGTIFAPLRNALNGNLLMATYMARALRRLDEIAHDSVRPLLVNEARLLLAEVARADLLPEDERAVLDRMGPLGPRAQAAARQQNNGGARTEDLSPDMHDDPAL